MKWGVPHWTLKYLQMSHYVSFLTLFVPFCPPFCVSVCLYTRLSVCLPACLYVLSIQSMDSSDLSDGPITLQEYLEVKKALASSEAKVQQLMKVNNNLSEELRRLQKEVGSVVGGWKDGENKVRGSTYAECWEIQSRRESRKWELSSYFIYFWSYLIIVESNRGQ